MDGYHDITVAMLGCMGESTRLIGVDLLGEVYHLGEHVVEFRGGEVGGLVSVRLQFLSLFLYLRVFFQRPTALLNGFLVISLLGVPWRICPSLACTCGLNSQ